MLSESELESMDQDYRCSDYFQHFNTTPLIIELNESNYPDITNFDANNITEAVIEHFV